MTLIPPAILLVNADLTDTVVSQLNRQLYLNEVLDGYAWDARLAADPNINTTVKSSNKRIMVVRNLLEQTNRDAFDVVIFISQGQASILQDKFGPPRLTLPVVRLTWHELGIDF